MGILASLINAVCQKITWQLNSKCYTVLSYSSDYNFYHRNELSVALTICPFEIFRSREKEDVRDYLENIMYQILLDATETRL